MSIPLLVVTGLLTLATGIIVLVAVRLVRALRHAVELEQRVMRLQEGINLLTDTAETGFRQVAAEIERLSTAASAAPAAPEGAGEDAGGALAMRAAHWPCPRTDGCGRRRRHRRSTDGAGLPLPRPARRRRFP